MAKVIRRIFTAECEYRDEIASFIEADALAGRRVDRRCNYAIIHGQLCESLEFTDQCSGCNNGSECLGCRECGYTGKRRQGHWVSLPLAQLHRDVEEQLFFGDASRLPTAFDGVVTAESR